MNRKQELTGGLTMGVGWGGFNPLNAASDDIKVFNFFINTLNTSFQAC